MKLRCMFVFFLATAIVASASVTNIDQTRMRITIDKNATNIQIVGDVVLSNEFSVVGAATFGDSVTIGGDTRSYWYATTDGVEKVEGDTYWPNFTNAQNDMDGIFTVAGAFNASGAVSAASTLDVAGAAGFADVLDVDGAASVAGVFSSSGAVALASTLDVVGTATFDGEISAQEMSDEVYAMSYGSLTYAAFTQALAAASGKTLVVDGGTWSLTDDVTVPSNVTVQVRRGSLISVASGKTITLNGYADAGLYQIFAGDGDFTLNQTVYPEWWGAVADDDACDVLAIQGAIDSSGVVELRSGQYDLDYDNSENQPALLKISKSFVFDLGGAELSVLQNDSQTNQVVLIENATNVIVRNGTLLGDRDIHTGTVGEWGYGVCIGGVGGGTRCSEIRIEDITVKDVRGDGFFIEPNDGSNIFVRGCISDRARRNGITIESGNNILVENSVFKNTHGTAPQAGCDIESDRLNNTSKNISFIGCSFSDNARIGMNVNPGYGLFEGITISGCNFNNNCWSNIPQTLLAQLLINGPNAESETRGLRGINVVGNQFMFDIPRLTNVFVKVQNNARNVIIQDNVIIAGTNIVWPESVVDAFYLSASPDAVISDNYSFNTYYAMNAYWMTNLTVSGNTFDYGYGITLASGCNNADFIGNKMKSGADLYSRAFTLASVTNVVIKGNVIHDGGYGIFLYAASAPNIKISDNSFIGQTTAYVHVFSGRLSNFSLLNNEFSALANAPSTALSFSDNGSYDDLQIIGNSIHGFTQRGLLVQYATNLTIMGNAFDVRDIPDGASQAFLVDKSQKVVSSGNMFSSIDLSYTNLSSFAGYQYSTNITAVNNVPDRNVLDSFTNELFYYCGEISYQSPSKVRKIMNEFVRPWYYGDTVFDGTNWFIAKGTTTNDWLQISN